MERNDETENETWGGDGGDQERVHQRIRTGHPANVEFVNNDPVL